MSILTNARYDDIGEIYQNQKSYILWIETTTRLKELNVLVADDVLVHYTLNSLQIEFEQLKILTMLKGRNRVSCAYHYLIQEEDRINRDKAESSH